MKTNTLPNRFPRKFVVGEKASFARTITEADVALFIGVTWDVNPLHTDDVYASGTPFGKRIVPGLLTASLLTHMGGLWAFMANQMQFQFIAPVFIGETITAEAEIIEMDEEKGWVRLYCCCLNENGEKVLTGDVAGYPGKFED